MLDVDSGLLAEIVPLLVMSPEKTDIVREDPSVSPTKMPVVAVSAPLLVIFPAKLTSSKTSSP